MLIPKKTDQSRALMEVFQARLDSFLKTKRIKGTVINWPHPDHFLATPNSLAEAGFYFCPTWDERDAVKCFMCGKELSDWLEDDDPFAIHWRKCPTSCPWAILRCGLQNDLDRDGKCVSTRLMYTCGSILAQLRVRRSNACAFLRLHVQGSPEDICFLAA